MGNYENGAFTRNLIISACNRLFYEKGFHETSYNDICELAHVNRGTIYYHFPSKEDMRYDVLWNYVIADKHLVERYCPDSRYHYILALAVFCIQTHDDANMRRFCLQMCMDYPIYTGKNDISRFYYTLYDQMWGVFWEKRKISQLSFASVYGYVMCCIRMLCESPERYSAEEMFLHSCNSSASVWGIPQEIINTIWPDVHRYLALIPEEELKVQMLPLE